MKYYYVSYIRSDRIDIINDIVINKHPLLWKLNLQYKGRETIILFWSEIPVEVYNEYKGNE